MKRLTLSEKRGVVRQFLAGNGVDFCIGWAFWGDRDDWTSEEMDRQQKAVERIFRDYMKGKFTLRDTVPPKT